MTKYWVWLSTRKNLRMQTAVALIKAFGDAKAVFDGSKDDYISAVSDITSSEVDSLCQKSLDAATQIVATSYMYGISILTYQDSMYPDRLRNIPDPPMVLYYMGCFQDFDRLPGVAVVGTRTPSVYGRRLAHKLGKEIAKCGGVVISGLAAGIDSIALASACSRDHKCVGVLGCGLDLHYPASTFELRRDIEKNGCVISEFPPGTKPLPQNFAIRNRLISGLAFGVVIVEAPKGSGALITAEHALEQNRDIFVVPGNVGAKNSYGCNKLLANGAVSVENGWSVMVTYKERFPAIVGYNIGRIDLSKYPGLKPIVFDEVQPSKEAGQQTPDDSTPANPAEENCASKTPISAEPEQTDSLPSNPEPKTDRELPTTEEVADMQESSDESCILQALKGQQLSVDEVIDVTQLKPAQVLAALTTLETKGFVVRHPGKIYSLAETAL